MHHLYMIWTDARGEYHYLRGYTTEEVAARLAHRVARKLGGRIEPAQDGDPRELYRLDQCGRALVTLVARHEHPLPGADYPGLHYEPPVRAKARQYWDCEHYQDRTPPRSLFA